MTTNNRVRIKQEAGWFVAGDGFARALEMLSDGAFRLFAWICLQAHRPSGRLEVTHKQLAAVLGKSRRSLGVYIAELEHKGICRIRRAANQHARTMFEIAEGYWPYEREEPGSSAPDLQPCHTLNESQSDYEAETESARSASEVRSYVAQVRELFLALGCGKGSFSPADKQTAEDLANRGIPLELVRDALLVGEVRKYMSWLNNGDSAPIGSLKYFTPVIDELQRQPLPAGYREYLSSKAGEFASQWRESKPRIDSSTDLRCDPPRVAP